MRVCTEWLQIGFDDLYAAMDGFGGPVLLVATCPTTFVTRFSWSSHFLLHHKNVFSTRCLVHQRLNTLRVQW